MKKNFLALVIAISVPFSSLNARYCLADESFTSRSYLGQFDYNFDRKMKNNYKLDEINEEEIQMLKQRVKELEKKEFRNANKKPSFWRSTWNSVKSIFKAIFSVGLGATAAGGSLFGAAILISGSILSGKAIYDCVTDDKCHFTDNSFLKKFDRSNFKKTFSSLRDLTLYILNHVNFIIVKDFSEDE